ncbi:MAG: hypothetical protein NTU63_00065 [Candidatus Pacearchaeota archaeon]|nr:hypothetical protein [Candidatus Pacearchaeota archaeon]
MIEERKTHYSDMRYCKRFGKKILVEQMKSTGRIIIQCRYLHLDGCHVNFDPNNSHEIRYFKSESCPLKLEKIVNVIED